MVGAYKGALEPFALAIEGRRLFAEVYGDMDGNSMDSTRIKRSTKREAKTRLIIIL